MPAAPTTEVERAFSQVRYRAFRSLRLILTTFGLGNLVVAAIQYKMAETVTHPLRLVGIAQVAVIVSSWFFTERTHRIGAALHLALVGLLAALTLFALGFTPGGTASLIWLCVVASVFYGRWGAALATGTELVMLTAAVLRAALGANPVNPGYGTMFVPVDLSLRWSIATLTVSCILVAAVVAATRGLEQAARDLSNAIERERKGLESLARARRLEVAGRLAGGVAHDLNNMLTPIVAYGSQLKESYPHSPDVAEAASGIVTAAKSAAGLVRQLLVFSKPGSQAVAPVDVHAVVDATVTLLKRTIDRKVTLESRLAAKRHTVMGDAGMLQNALVNLALNARDAMPDGGTLVLATEMSGEDTLEIRVTDTGTGMSADVQGKVFEPFFTTKKDGVGLGLASVFGTVQQHHGTVDVESAPGKGTTFRLKLPLAADAVTLRVAAPAPVNAPRTGRVLVVDDEDLVRRVIVRLLTRRGLECKEASDGKAGLDAFNADKGAYSLIVMDSEMPVMSGRVMLEHVRQQDAQVPVIVVSGYLKDGAADALAPDQRLRMLNKPFDPERLMALVDELLPPK